MRNHLFVAALGASLALAGAAGAQVTGTSGSASATTPGLAPGSASATTPGVAAGVAAGQPGAIPNTTPGEAATPPPATPDARSATDEGQSASSTAPNTKKSGRTKKDSSLTRRSSANPTDLSPTDATPR